MSDLYAAIASHLNDLCPAASGVTSATSVAEVDSMVIGPVPTVVVIPAAESWTPPREVGLWITVSGRLAFSCIVALTAPAGGEAWSEIRAQLRAALLGWTPAEPEVAGPVEARGARLLSYSAERGGRWLHAFDFTLPAQASYGIQ